MKQDDKNPLLTSDLAPDITQKAINMFSEAGMIGGPLKGIQDILARKQDVYFIKYEDLARHPLESMERLYCYLEQPSFEHDFENVVNTATDPDHITNNKYPHKGEGKVELQPNVWPKLMSENLADSIMAGFPWYNQRFGYRMPKKADPLPQATRAPGPGLAELKTLAAEQATR